MAPANDCSNRRRLAHGADPGLQHHRRLGEDLQSAGEESEEEAEEASD